MRIIKKNHTAAAIAMHSLLSADGPMHMDRLLERMAHGLLHINRYSASQMAYTLLEALRDQEVTMDGKGNVRLADKGGDDD